MRRSSTCTSNATSLLGQWKCAAAHVPNIPRSSWRHAHPIDELFISFHLCSVFRQDDAGGEGGAIYNAGTIVVRKIAEFPSNMGGVGYRTYAGNGYHVTSFQ